MASLPMVLSSGTAANGRVQPSVMTTRVFLHLLICIAIAFQGVASARVVAQPCPMEQGSASMGIDLAAAGHPCCNDADTRASTGEVCKTGQECPLSQALMLGFDGAFLMSLSLNHRPALMSAPLSFDPSSVWRPPTLS